MNISAFTLRRIALPAAIAWTLLIAVVLLMPGSEAPSLAIPLGDKLVHAGVFGFGSALWLIALPGNERRVLAGIVVFAILTELAQGAMGWGRSAELGDVVADVLGASAAYVAVGWWQRRRRKATESAGGV